MAEDEELEVGVLEALKFRNECSDSQLEENEKFEVVAVLSLVKSLLISESKLDVLRFWIRDMMRPQQYSTLP